MKKSPAVSTESLKSTIRGAGLRSTSPRLVVLRRLFEASTPISHSELFDGLADEGLDRTTVYRNLVDLTGVGLVERTDLGDHVWRFELKRNRLSPDGGGHVHFTCTDCGTVSCLDEVEVKVKSGRRAPRAVVSQKVEVALRGLCDECG
jgi:Fur family ferric uptake transcriptional regulator